MNFITTARQHCFLLADALKSPVAAPGGFSTRLLSTLLLLFCGAAITHSQELPHPKPDLNFTTNGEVNAIVTLADGKLIIAGAFDFVNELPRNSIARLNRDGTLDTTWDAGFGDARPGVPNATVVHDLIVDGVDLFVAGRIFIDDAAAPRRAIVKLDLASGAVDTTWASYLCQGALALEVNAEAVFIGGSFTEIGASPRGGLAKFDRQSGTLDPLWTPELEIDDENDAAECRVLLLNGGELYVGGHFDGLDGSQRSLAAIDPIDGSLDDGFEPEIEGDVEALVRSDRGGRLYAFGSFRALDGEAVNMVSLSHGSGNAKSWGSGAFEDANILTALLDGDYVYVGGRLNQAGDWLVERLALSDGSPDGLGVDFESSDPRSEVRCLAVDGGDLLIGGTIQSIDDQSTLGMARVSSEAGELVPGGQAQVQRTGRIEALAIDADGRVIVGGDFRFVDGLQRDNLARILPDGNLDLGWTPAANGVVRALAIVGGDLFIGGRFTRIGGANIAYLARISQGTTTGDPLWDAEIIGPDPEVRAIVPLGAYLYFGGSGFERVNDRNQNGALAAVQISNAERLHAWRPADDFADTITSLATDGTDVFVAGLSNLDGGGLRYPGLNKFTADEGDPVSGFSFDPLDLGDDLATEVRELIVDESGNLYVAGQFWFEDNSVPFGGLARVDPATGATFRAYASQPLGEMLDISALGTSPGTVYLASETTGVARIDLGSGDLIAPLESEITPAPVRTIASGAGRVYLGGEATSLRRNLTMFTILSAPSVAYDFPTGMVQLFPHPRDGTLVSHFQIQSFDGGSLFLPGGEIPVQAGDFISADDAAAGLVWQPAAEGVDGEISVAAAIASQAGGAGRFTATAALTIISGNGAVAQFTSAIISVSESDPSVRVSVSLIAGSGTVKYAIKPGSAEAIVAGSGVGDFVEQNPGTEEMPGTLEFTGPGTLSIPNILIFDDDEDEGDEFFTIVLSDPTGDIVLGNPAITQVRIIDNELVGPLGSELVRIDPPGLPESFGELRVNLSGTPAAQWRLVGELAWRDSWDAGGTAATGLSSGNYWVQFKPVDGFQAPAPKQIPVDGSLIPPLNLLPPPTERSYAYNQLGDANPGRGSLSVIIEPAEVANATAEEERGQWRRQGEGTWLDSGEFIEDLPAGIYFVEFKGVDGRSTPGVRSVSVEVDQVNLLTEVYLFDTTLEEAESPSALTLTGIAESPWAHTGQIRTEFGFGSGVVTKTRVVLTAGHVLFDDISLSYAREVTWMFRRHAGEHESPPIVPRGWLHFEGYAAQRRVDVEEQIYGPGTGSPASQNLDVAAMFFETTPGNGGAAGYLSGGAEGEPNDWLLGERDKVLVGYPITGIPVAQRGKMHSTSVGNIPFSHLQNGVYSTTAARSFPGNSGGPIFARHDNGKLYPAAIYLGGRDRSVVRAIDDRVVDLMNRAQLGGDGNSTGNGVGRAEPGLTQDRFPFGFLRVDIAGGTGSWRRVDADGSPLDSFFPSGSTLEINPGTFFIELAPRAGYETGQAKTVTVYDGQLTLRELSYSQSLDNWTEEKLGNHGVADDGPLDDYDVDGIPHLLEFAFGLEPTIVDRSSYRPGGEPRGLPTVWTEGSGSDAKLVIAYIRRRAVTNPGIEYICQFGNRPKDADFQPTTGIENVTQLDGIWEQVVVEDVGGDGEGMRFGRVKVTIGSP